MKRKFLIKVCGMRDSENITQVAVQEPSLMGFIFYPGSPRYVGDSFRLPDSLSPCVKRVGVVVNESVQEIKRIADRHHLNYVQLHGDESVDEVKALYELGISVIKVFRIDEQFDFASTLAYQAYVEYFLFDTKGENYGGNAKRFPWKVLEKYTGAIPFLLSGGIGLEHLEEVKKLGYGQLAGIDLNSGVEQMPGVKDVEKVKKVIHYFKREGHEI